MGKKLHTLQTTTTTEEITFSPPETEFSFSGIGLSLLNLFVAVYTGVL